MQVKKLNGINVIVKITKPIPEIINFKFLDLDKVLIYLDELNPGISDLLLNYWLNKSELNYEVSYLSLPENSEQFAPVILFLLDEYPDWEEIQFNIIENLRVNNG